MLAFHREFSRRVELMMITNERQYRITHAQAQRFQHALDEFDDRARPDLDPRLAQAERAALASQLADLREELKKWRARPD